MEQATPNKAHTVAPRWLRLRRELLVTPSVAGHALAAGPRGSERISLYHPKVVDKENREERHQRGECCRNKQINSVSSAQ